MIRTIACLSLAPFAFCVLSGCSSAPAKDESTKPFQGAWVFVSLEEKGQKIGEKVLKARAVEIAEDNFRIQTTGADDVLAVDEYVLRVDDTKSPAELDLLLTDGEKHGEKMLGIFAFEGDELKICFAEIGRPRPTEFAAKSGEVTLMVLKRQE